MTWVDNEDASKEVCKASLRPCMKWSEDKKMVRPINNFLKISLISHLMVK